MNIPKIKPLDTKEYKLKQSKYDNVPGLPCRTILLAPSNSGKSVMLSNFINDIYKDCFERVYIFSPSINLDDVWKPVKTYLDSRNKTDDKIYFDEYNMEELLHIIDVQEKLINYQKEKEHKQLFQIAIIIDDFADDPIFMRSSKILHSLFTRGRHKLISTFVSSQKFAALAPIIRVNASSYIVFRLRNSQDLEMFLNEMGALFKNKNELFDLYKKATEKPFSFLYVDLTTKDPNKLFYQNFDESIKITNNDNKTESNISGVFDKADDNTYRRRKK